MEKIIENWIEVEINTGYNSDYIRETLTRMGIGNNKKKIIYQTAHLVCCNGRYFICHFKELFPLVDKEMIWVDGDLERRNKIIKLLVEWDMITVVDPESMYCSYDQNIYLGDEIKVFKIGRKFADEWHLQRMFNMKSIEHLGCE